MRKTTLILLVFVMAMINYSCKKSEKVNTEPVIVHLNEKSKKLVSSSNDFGIDLFKLVANSNKSEAENILVSPLSVSLALAMTYNGADGDTKTAMAESLRLKALNTEEINANFKFLIETLTGLDKKTDFSIANSIWYRNTFSVLQDFITTNQDYYSAEVKPLDFNDVNSKDLINNWVAENTNNKIDKIVDNISPSTVMFLINAIYFNGVWKYEFDASKNYKYAFKLANGTNKELDFMIQTADLKRYQNEIVSIVEMVYGQGNWAIDLILPAEGKSVDNVIANLSSENWNSWMAALSAPSETTISLPPFKYDYELKLNEALSQMGMGIAFNRNEANFSKINNDAQLFISSVKHKAFIELDEKGTEAAAVTSVEVGVTNVGDEFSIVYDKPFLFVIRELSTGAILFIGQLENPER